MLIDEKVLCPYCGEKQQLVIDCSEEEQSYYEDCQACCAPMLIEIGCSFEQELEWIAVKSDRE